MRVLFWGTPDFATPALRALIGEGFDVVGVVTQPDKPVGRSRSSVVASPVKALALDEGLPVLQPDRLVDNGGAGAPEPGFLARVQELDPEISVVIAYGRILPQALIDLPARGTLNVHASLLPRLRGAAPIHGAIQQGLVETGISIMRMVPALDAGPVLLRVATPIIEDETHGELAMRLSEMGALALIEALSLIELGRSVEELQDETQASYARKVDRSHTWVDWHSDAGAVSRVIRAFDPQPGARTTLRGGDLKVFGAHVATFTGASEPGQILYIGADGMVVACQRSTVRVTSVQPAAKKRLSPVALARGRGIAIGDRLGADSTPAT